MQALIDFVAQQPEALLDAPGDPRVGMSGGSYRALPGRRGQGRLDADPCGAGEANGLAPGLIGSPAGIQTASTDPHIKSACASGIGLGTVSEEDKAWFAARGPAELMRRIRIPTLLTQGTVDTLFPLDEAERNFEILRSNGVPAKMIWHCGGHGVCLTGQDDGELLQRRGLQGLDRHLERDTTVDTGPRFEWVADDGATRAGPDYPLAPAGELTGSGSGTLAFSPDPVTSGALILATPGVNAVNVDVPGPRAAADVLGAPQLRMTYRGTAVNPQTHLFAQLVDVGRKCRCRSSTRRVRGGARRAPRPRRASRSFRVAGRRAVRVSLAGCRPGPTAYGSSPGRRAVGR